MLLDLTSTRCCNSDQASSSHKVHHGEHASGGSCTLHPQPSTETVI